MISKWFELKPRAIRLRESGYSIRDVEKRLGISRSTLSGWFKDVKLNEEQNLKLRSQRRISLGLARSKAVEWHNQQKAIRLDEAKYHAKNVLSKININDKSILELALAMLYIGEGAKTQRTSLGNTNPEILRFFIAALVYTYNYDIKNIKCELHLRADQDSGKMKKFWSKALDIPLENFTYIAFDKRTLGSKTYDSYKGVCVVGCGNIALQRRLVYLSEAFCKKVASLRAVSSVGRASA